MTGIAIEVAATPAGTAAFPGNPQVPPGGWWAGSAYDAADDRIIVYGGDTYTYSSGGVRGQKPINETWVYDLNANRWQNMTRDPNPGPRFTHAMAYDARARRVILFGGTTYYPRGGDLGSSFLQDTWAYDYGNNSWERLETALKPSARSNARMVYDAGLERIVLFGGESPVRDTLNDTWAFDSLNLTWTNLSPAYSPPGRLMHSMAYDPVAKRTILFGGWADHGEYPGDHGDDNETYAFDSAAGTWENLTTATGPPRREGAGMAFDDISGLVVLVGGGSATVPSFSDAWAFAYASGTWTRLEGDPAPGATMEGQLVSDLESRATVFFGGVLDRQHDLTNGFTGDLRAPLRSTWAFDGSNGNWSLMDRPKAVDWFSATPGTERVLLEWYESPQPKGTVIVGFNVYRGLDGANLTLLAEGVGNQSYEDSTAEPNHAYWYAVAPVAPAGQGFLSEVKQATSEPASLPPQGNGSPSGGVSALWVLPMEAGAVVLLSILLAFLAGALVNEYGFRRMREPPEE